MMVAKLIVTLKLGKDKFTLLLKKVVLPWPG
jgi:hypothetical protein